MSLEAILTVVTIVLAVIALIPQERAQDLRIRFGGPTAWLSSVASLLVLYWSLIEPLHSLPWLRQLPRPIPWLDGWDPASTSLLLVLAVTGITWRSYGKQLPVYRIPQLSSAISDALARRRFPEVAHLLEAHLTTLGDALNQNYWQARARIRYFPTYAELDGAAIKLVRRPLPAPELPAGVDPPATTSELSNDLVISLPTSPERSALAARFISWAENPHESAHQIVRSIGLTPGFARYIAEANPYLGLALLRLPSTWLVREFAEAFAKALLADPDSVFYRELRRAENIGLHGVPVVEPSEQPILAALCRDADSPSGATLLYTFLAESLDSLIGPDNGALRERLNRPMVDYYEESRWTSPPFAAVYLIEIVGPRNAISPLAQNVNLYDLLSLVTIVLAELNPASDVDLTREFPTPFHYLIYASISALTDIISIWQDRPSDLPRVKLEDLHEGVPRILPAHAIDVLGNVMYEVLRSPKLDARFKGDMLEVWWKVYWEKYKKPWPQSDLVLASLKRGGHCGDRQMKHLAGLSEALDHVDIMTQSGEGGHKVREAFGLPPRAKHPGS